MRFTRIPGPKRHAPAVLLLAVFVLALPDLMAQTATPEDGRQSLKAIGEAARLHVEQLHRGASADVVVEPGHIDPRLRLKDCDAPLEATVTGTSSRNANTTVKVQCPGAWRLFVPVAVRFRTQVVVLAHPVSRGTVLESEHLGTRVTDVKRLAHGYFDDPDLATGQVMRRPAVPGTVLTPSMLEPAIMIKKGQTVRLIVSARNFRINASGEALADAVEGQRLRVRNLSSQRIVEGVVVGPETVEIP